MIRGPKIGFLSDVILAWLPFLVVFVSIPLNIFVPNLIEFNYDLSIVVPFLTVGAFSLIALLGFWFLKPLWRLHVSLGLFYVGTFMLLSDIFAPLHWNILDAETEIPEPWRQTVVELFLVALLVLCWAKVPTKLIKGFGVPLTLVLLVSQLIYLFLGWQEWSEHNARETLRSVSASKSDSGILQTKRGNVYHIVFDEYSSLIFLDAVRQLDMAATFSGFTYFENTLSNYEATDLAVPSFLAGRIYTDGSLMDWRLRAKDNGLRRQLQDSGYEISVYSPEKTRAWMYKGASHVRTSQEISQSYIGGSAEFRLAQLSLVRLAPSALRIETFRETDWQFGKVLAWLNNRANSGTQNFSRYAFYKTLSVPLIRQFLVDEKERNGWGSYVYVHVILPHNPFVWDSACKYAAKTTYKEQTLCATRLMSEIIEELKRHRRFDNSLIIFQSDHGSHRSEAGDPNPEFEPPQDIRNKVHAVVTPVFDTEGYFRRIHSLLIIKPPFSAFKPLRISHAPAQLVDLPATLYDVLGIDGPATDGESVFDLRESKPREIHLYPGTFTMKSRARDWVLGRGMTTSSLVHISYTQGQGWRAYPDLPVSFD